MKKMTNEELAVRAQKGDEESLIELWKSSRGLCMKYAKRFFPLCALVGMEREDLEQEIFFGFYKAVQRYDGSRNVKFSTVLYYYVRSCCEKALDIRNGKKIKIRPLSLDYKSNSGENGSEYSGDATLANIMGTKKDIEDLENKMFNKQLEEVLWQLLEELPPKRFEVLYLRYYCGMTFTEIGERLNKTTQAAQNLHSRAMKQLRENPKLQDFARGLSET